MEGVSTSGPVGPTPLTGIAATSAGVAVLRARESSRPDRLFDDPYAALFLTAAAVDQPPWEGAQSQGLGFFELMAGQVAVRTRFLDEVMLNAASAGCHQVVLLACGLDSRAFRLDWPTDTVVFEVDFPDVLQLKQAVLTGAGATPRCRRVEVAADLRTDWPGVLRAAGLQPHAPTAWLTEGILYGLSPAAADLLLDRITELSAVGSVLAADHCEDSEVLRAARGAISAELVDLWRGGPHKEIGAWLRERGWEPNVEDIASIAARYGRPTPPAFDRALDGTGHGWLATARLPER